jgi:hypothetical protein
MLADLDLLLTAVFCAADDLLPKRAKNARRRIIDAEVVTLCVAQAMLGIASVRHLRTARGLLRRLADDGALARTAGRRTTFAPGPRLQELAAAVLGDRTS